MQISNLGRPVILSNSFDHASNHVHELKIFPFKKKQDCSDTAKRVTEIADLYAQLVKLMQHFQDIVFV